MIYAASVLIMSPAPTTITHHCFTYSVKSSTTDLDEIAQIGMAGAVQLYPQPDGAHYSIDVVAVDFAKHLERYIEAESAESKEA